MPKYQVRAKMQELKPTGLDLITRKKIAKRWLRGDYMGRILSDLGFVVVKAYGCDCCDPHAYQTWQRGNKQVTTAFGILDIPKPAIA